MAFTCSNIKYSDMIFIYGLCNGDANAAAKEYRCKYQNSEDAQTPEFCRVHHLQEKGTFPGIRLTAEWVGAENSDGRGIVQMAAGGGSANHHSPAASKLELKFKCN